MGVMGGGPPASQLDCVATGTQAVQTWNEIAPRSKTMFYCVGGGPIAAKRVHLPASLS